MHPSILAEIEQLPKCTVAQLRDRYEQVFGEPTASRHRTYLARRIAWRLQANAEGGLSERAKLRAAQLAAESDFRVTAPRKTLDEPAGPVIQAKRALPVSQEPVPGVVLTREWKGVTHQVEVLPNGYVHQGTVYKSLSAVANAITGTRWNGYVFFGLKKRQPTKKQEASA
jgi:hypothetical protein